jgi:hypothetical protein
VAKRLTPNTHQQLEAIGLEPLVRQHKAAVFLDVSESTLERWRYLGVGPPYVQLTDEGRAIAYRASDLRDYVDARVRRGSDRAD